MRRPRLSRGFTLVELLVVIGIIALLISILLPSLNAARRQAKAVKCLSQLREIGNFFQQYAIESKGWYPPSQLRMAVGGQYSLPQSTIDNREIIVKQSDGYGVFWFNFLNKYASKSAAGIYNNGDKGEADTVRNSTLWGCPDWAGFLNTTYGYNRVQPGYGMNGYPTFAANYPIGSSYPPVKDWSWNDNSVLWSTTANQGVGFVRQVIWGKRGAERALVMDSRFWLADSTYVNPVPGTLPEMMQDQNVGNYQPGQTNASVYRHGKFPPAAGNNQFQKTGGKVAYNILYCDGHCATATDVPEAYKSLRMKFPG